jgi:hypothetical protein
MDDARSLRRTKSKICRYKLDATATNNSIANCWSDLAVGPECHLSCIPAQEGESVAPM